MNWKQALRLLFIILGVLALDTISKGLTQSYFKPFESAPPIYPFGGIAIFQFFGIDFCIHHVTNRGAAWGVGSSWQTLLLVLRIAVVVSLALYVFFSLKAADKRYALTLVVAGGLGNIIDYFIYGHVVDMFHFIFWGYSYPVFNIADISIFFGIVALLWKSRGKARTQDAFSQKVLTK